MGMIPAEAVDLAELIDRTINDEYDPGDDVMGMDLAPAILAAGWRKQHRDIPVTVISGPPADLTGVLAKHLHDLGYRKVEQ